MCLPSLCLGCLCSVCPGLLSRRWANESMSIYLISLFYRSGNWGPGRWWDSSREHNYSLSLDKDCASHSRESHLLPPWPSVCLSCSSRGGMHRAVGEKRHPPPPNQPCWSVVTDGRVEYPPHSGGREVKLCTPGFPELSGVVSGGLWRKEKAMLLLPPGVLTEEALHTPGQNVRTVLENRSGQTNDSIIPRVLMVQPQARDFRGTQEKQWYSLPFENWFHIPCRGSLQRRQSQPKEGNWDAGTPWCSAFMEIKARGLWEALHV